MFILRAGCRVPFPEKLFEEYMLTENQIIANISADKIKSVMEHFICIHEEPLFFILELPSEQNDEKEIQPGVVENLHKDVYYIDGCANEEALTILLRIGDLMINDGLCSFGFGCHESNDEIMFGKYNVTTIFSRNIRQYIGFMADHEIAKKEHILTAWDTFSYEHPGSSKRINTDGKDVFSIPEMFADWGIYKAEQRED
ncbi:MAG: hypothetical protein IK097_05145 [Clostridia bacterium]|nr:hypothetical protein [Clostridia bacterium]